MAQPSRSALNNTTTKRLSHGSIAFTAVLSFVVVFSLGTNGALALALRNPHAAVAGSIPLGAQHSLRSTDFARIESIVVNATGMPIAGLYDPRENRMLFVIEAAAQNAGIYTMISTDLTAQFNFQKVNIPTVMTAAVIQPEDYPASPNPQALRGVYIATSSSAILNDDDDQSVTTCRSSDRSQIENTARIYRLNPTTLEVEDQLVGDFPSGKLSMVIDINKRLYVATRTSPNRFYEISMSRNLTILRTFFPSSLNMIPTSGFVDLGSRFLYFISNSTVSSQVLRIDLETFASSRSLNIPLSKGRVNSVLYEPNYEFAYLPMSSRTAGLIVVSLKNFTFLPDFKFDGTEQSLFASYFDYTTSQGFVGSNTAPGNIYWTDFSVYPPVYIEKITLNVPEDYLYSVAHDYKADVTVWGGQGFYDNPSLGLFPIFVSVRIPSDNLQPSDEPDPDDPSNNDDDPSIPLPIFVAALFVSVGAVALLAVIYYKKKGPQSTNRYDVLRASQPENALAVDPQIKIIDFNEIEMGELIGMGGMGEVHRAMWNGTEIAVKKLHMTYQNLSSTACQDISDEMLLHSTLRHPNIITFMGACIYVPNICICLEYMPRHSLYEVLHSPTADSLSWATMLKMAQDAARGMNFLHSSKPVIIHRDLKSHNLLVDSNWAVKVTDFGSARMKQHFAYTMTCIGTPQWMAPEVIRGEKYTEKCDIFSFGVVLWELFSREDPHKGMNPIQVATAVAFRDLRPSIPSNCPPSFSNLFTECWDANPKVRPPFRDILARLAKMMEGSSSSALQINP
eukprot:TRINITY_DN7734_c0_g1_i2.p1 TRINITY_DN7734_c0_g1~~TRINITY_DN7734_c0_g1_i2.p1  ORF type:complete len:791 (+),score=168.71 TRINITY_DN7734_c0_g1_i2:48-2420(+)